METTELKQDEQTVEVIEHRSVDTMRNAVISGQGVINHVGRIARYRELFLQLEKQVRNCIR